ncbi:MAG TPA: hypothetical protein VFQ39_12560 [Longimicrobium sp.]|nr:hypothetical protein [Longimicrobium sp.]
MRRREALALAAAALLLGACQRERPFELGEVMEVNAPTPDGSSEPNLATGPDGRVWMSWVQPGPDSTHALRVAVLDSMGWKKPRTAAQGARWMINWADFPSVLPLPGGRLAVHWLERSDTAKYAYGVRVAQSFTEGASWTPGAPPHRDGTPTEHGFVSLWPARGDSVGAVWLDGRAFVLDPMSMDTAPRREMALMSASLSRDGGMGPERYLDRRVCDCCQTGLAMTSKGPLVVYRDRTADEIRDIYAVRWADTAWGAPHAVHADGWKIEGCPVNGPQASADGDRVAVAWFTAARDTPRVNVAFSGDAGDTFAPPVRVDGGNPVGRVDVEMVEGGALVTWMERSGGENAEVRVRFVARDGRLGDPKVVAKSSAARAAGFPRMAVSGNTVLFAWTEPGTPSRIRMARALRTEAR